MIEKLEKILQVYEDLTARVADPKILADPKEYARVSKERADMEETVNE